jgi:dipeptidyl aminopeptidase/acylaminoacyl peptidase
LSYEWFDSEEKAIYDQLGSIIPYADRITISSRSRDGKSLIINNRGPRDPGTFYLLKDGTLSVVGSTKPGLMSKDLADVEAISYEARDGKKIRGFITIPNSKPPYPLVVMPHGGPFVPENPAFDEWAQMLANQGFMVLQPQYRGSKYFGLDFYKTAFINGGQGGYQMQDDKDDGALYLVEKGLVDPNRMMMFGWSYGGYASLVAAARTPQIYHCVIAGATVPDPIDQVNYYRSELNSQKDSRQAQEQLNFWLDSVSPIKEVAKVNIPMLIVHGDVDQRTPPRAARKYMKALKEHDKDHKVLWLEGADHFSDTLFYHHKIELYTAMTDYLANDCFKNSNKVAQR